MKFERAEYGYTDNSRTGICYKRLSRIKTVCSPEINERFNEKCSVTVEELIVTKVARESGCEISLKIKSTLQKICQRAPALEQERLLFCLTEGRFH